MKRLLRVEFLVVHHSLTKDGQVVDWVAIDRFHTSWRYDGHIITPEEARELIARKVKGVEPPWEDNGYHYGIEQVRDIYQIMRGRPESYQGAHCREQSMNTKSLGICVVGNFDLAPPPEPALALLVELCAGLCQKYGLGPERIEPHHKFATYKTCPGKKFPMEELRARVRAKLDYRR